MTELIDIFKNLGYDGKYFRQGSLSNNNWPDSFFTFWNYNSSAISYRDNELKKYSEDYMVYFYTNDISILYTEMDRFINAAKKAGFIIQGKSYDIPSGRYDYFGRIVNIKIIKEEN